MTDQELDALVARAVAARPGSPEEAELLTALERQPIGELIEPPPGWEDRAVARWQRRRRIVRAVVVLAVIWAAAAIALLA